MREWKGWMHPLDLRDLEDGDAGTVHPHGDGMYTELRLTPEPLAAARDAVIQAARAYLDNSRIEERNALRAALEKVEEEGT